MVTQYSVGDKVVITERTLRIMENSNRSIKGHPYDSFIQRVRKLVGVVGVVSYTFPPGYEITARFGDQSFHMKDNYVERV